MSTAREADDAPARSATGSPGGGPSLALLLALGGGIALVFTCLAALVFIDVRDGSGVAALDAPALATAVSIRQPVLTALAMVLTDAAGTVVMPIIALAIMLTLAIRRRSLTPVALMTAATAGSLTLTIVGKNLIGRTRPALVDAVAPFETSPSFPSGHTLNAVVIAGIVAYLLILKQTTLSARIWSAICAAAFAAAVALTRIYLGHHWVTDVLAAAAIGVAWLAIVITTHQCILRQQSRRASSEGRRD